MICLKYRFNLHRNRCKEAHIDAETADSEKKSFLFLGSTTHKNQKMKNHAKYSWETVPPHIANRRSHPGLRHQSRLFTKPVPFIRPKDIYPDAQLKYVFNRFEAHSQCLMHLIDAMHLFSRQLPNMGTAYIARLVFDVNACSVLILHNGRVSGGICSRIFLEQKFIEIVFCAVDSYYQARGYGRLMMCLLKMYLQAMELFDILTCADNEAVTYFRKQGFNKHEIMMDPKRWVGCIKDYDGITLVHCAIRPDIDYLHFSDALSRQLEVVKEKTGFYVHQALPKHTNLFVPFTQSPSFCSIPLPVILEEYAPKLETRMKSDINEYKEEYDALMSDLRDRLIAVFKALKNDQHFNTIFLRPVTEDIAPGYFTMIKKPMDFWTIEKRLYRYPDYYKRPELFASDITLMCDNCKQFNSPDTPFYKIAIDLMKKFRQLYEKEFPEYPLP